LIPDTHDAAPAGRLAMASVQALSALRCDVIGAVGAPYAQGILYGIGYSEGLIDGLRLVRSFLCHGTTPPRRPGPGLPILFEPRSGHARGELSGWLRASIEAKLHQQGFGPSTEPVCFVTAGYAAGWYTELLDAPILVRERACSGRGDPLCEFEARPLDDWRRAADPWLTELLPYLDVDGLRARARVSLPESAAGDTGESEDAAHPGGVLGGFDAMSPAAHVWGPVMLLPYSGAEDSLAAIDTILKEVGMAQIRVVIIDLQGVRLDPRELAGVARVLAHARDRNLQGVVSGVASPRRARGELSWEDALTSTLHARTLTEAVALGFQLVRCATG
jgi:hypothetical protein